MNSIALSFETNQDYIIDGDTDLHINYWKLPSNSIFRNKYLRFIDFGIKINSPSKVNNVVIDWPFKLAQFKDGNYYLDLSETVSKNVDLLSSVFNENLTVEDMNSDYHKVKKDDEEFLHFISLKNISKYEIESKKLIINLSSFNGDIPLYFRFRIVLNKSIPLLRSTRNFDDFLKSGFDKDEVFEILVNVIRSLDGSLKKTIFGKIPKSFNKVHIFFICSLNERILTTSDKYNSTRILEDSIWYKYLCDDEKKTKKLLEKNKMFAYHWKLEKKSELSHLIYSRSSQNSLQTVLVYLIILIAISVFSNNLQNWISTILNYISPILTTIKDFFSK